MTTDEFDLGVDGPLFNLQIDKEAAAGSTLAVVVRTRSDSGCAWQDAGTTVVEEDQSQAELQITASRYVQVEQTVTGASVEGGVAAAEDGEFVPEIIP